MSNVRRHKTMSSPYDTFKREISLFTELEDQSDRGAAVVAAAWVEEELLEAIRTSLQSVPKSWDRLFGRSRPLDSLSAKIDMASLLGIISESVLLDLHTIRDIRNDFAHSIVTKTHEVLSFDSPHIKDKCRTLRTAAHESPASPRSTYLRSCAILNSDFHIYSKLAVAPDTIHRIQAKSET